MKAPPATKACSLKNKKMQSKAEFRDCARGVLGRTQQAAEGAKSLTGSRNRR
jgi:hypothetical protein